MTRTVVRGLLVACLAAAAIVLGLRAPRGVETDLLALAGGASAGPLAEVGAAFADRARVLLEGPEAAALVRVADDALGARRPPRTDFAAALRALRGHTAGLLSPAARAAIDAGRTGEVAAEAKARLFGPVPPLFSVKDDPFLLATGWALALQEGRFGGWTPQAGYLVRTGTGGAQLLATLDLRGASAAETADLAARLHARAAQEEGVDVFCAGPPFHAARTASRAAREINALSCVSLALVLFFGWRLFRSVAFAGPLLVALGVGFLAAAGALFAAFPRPHVLTFVFGTSLIGLSVDYVYHARAAGDVRRIRGPLVGSLITTLGCFAPLLFAEVPVLRQMALFTCAGLAAVFAWVMSGAPRAPGVSETTCVAPSGGRRLVTLLVVVVALCGLPRVRLATDPAAFYRPPPALAEAERRVAAALGGADGGAFAFIRGATLQECLAREEAAGLAGLSAVVPSLARQRADAARIARLYAAEGAAYAAATGLSLPAGKADFLDPARVRDPALDRLVAAVRVPGGIVAPCAPDFVSRDPHVTVIAPARALQDVFARFTRATCRLAGWAVVTLLLALVALLRRRFLRCAWPVLGATAATAGFLGWCGMPITFFTLLCFFVLVGLGLDYALFRASAAATAGAVVRTVRCSFLTSLAGLGLLAFTDFAVTRAMGVTFAVGLAFSYALSAFAAPSVAETVPEAWHARREQSAGRWRLAFLWGLYRICGKGALKVFCGVVMLFIYPFARPARRALAAYYGVLSAHTGRAYPPTHRRLFRHLLEFAVQLADKTDACTRKAALPVMTLRDDAGGRAFAACVASGRGAFLVTTHLGTAEVLPALARGAVRVPHVHAFQQLGHDAVFTEFFLRHFDATRVTLHAVEAIGVETASAMQAAIARGDLVVMAGDRVSAGSGRTLTRAFLGRPCAWPKGTFAFARLMESPVFFVTCVRTGWNAYEVHAEAAPAGAKAPELLAAYAAFLERETCAYPNQWFHFHPFWSDVSDGKTGPKKV